MRAVGACVACDIWTVNSPGAWKRAMSMPWAVAHHQSGRENAWLAAIVTSPTLDTRHFWPARPNQRNHPDILPTLPTVPNHPSTDPWWDSKILTPPLISPDRFWHGTDANQKKGALIWSEASWMFATARAQASWFLLSAQPRAKHWKIHIIDDSSNGINGGWKRFDTQR